MRSDLLHQLQTTLGGSYVLERELGGGAMSRVFAATESALGRRVVIKVLSHELAAGVSAERFAREIRFAASLQQANIVPVLSSGETAGMPFYTMPFVEGSSLRERLSRDGASAVGLPISEAIGVLRDVARALAYAHDRGVLHRDIKPENVLLSGDAAVVTDFGIAKAISAARTQDGQAIDARGTLTSAGVVVGTPAYMAPEQASGDPALDHRADLYAFGCLAYELITGRPPFHDRTVHELFTAHVMEPPRPLEEQRPDCPPGIAALVMQCLEKKPALRPASAREILGRLDSVTTPSVSRGADSIRKRTRWGLVAAALVAVSLAAALVPQFTHDPVSSRDSVKTIAVLPLLNVGGDSTQAYLADGMTDELATALGKVSGLRVTSRSFTYRYRDQTDVDVREAGRELRVAYVVTGTVRRVGDNLRVAAQLTNVADGVELWSDSYYKAASDVFGVQDEITRDISAALEPELRQDTTLASAMRGTKDPDAYDLYLRGRFLLERRGRGVRQSVENFRQAIARDSNFARAHAGLSTALELMPYFGGTPTEQVRPAATAAARRALELDSTSAEAHLALAMVAEHAYDWKTAGEEFRRAIDLAPREQPVRLQYGRYLLYTNRLDDGIAEFQLARAFDPYSALPSAWLGIALILKGRNAEALREMRRALEIDSLHGPALQLATMAYVISGQPQEAAAIAPRLSKSELPFEGNMAYALALTGNPKGALDIVRQLEREKPRRWMSETSIAYAYIALGDTARGLDALERATDARELWPSYMAISFPIFEPVRGSPRFAALLRRVGLQDYGFTPAR